MRCENLVNEVVNNPVALNQKLSRYEKLHFHFMPFAASMFVFL